MLPLFALALDPNYAQRHRCRRRLTLQSGVEWSSTTLLFFWLSLKVIRRDGYVTTYKAAVILYSFVGLVLCPTPQQTTELKHSLRRHLEGQDHLQASEEH